MRMKRPANQPRTCSECTYRFPDGSCQIHREIVTKPSSKGCARGLKVVSQGTQGVLG